MENPLSEWKKSATKLENQNEKMYLQCSIPKIWRVKFRLSITRKLCTWMPSEAEIILYTFECGASAVQTIGSIRWATAVQSERSFIHGIGFLFRTNKFQSQANNHSSAAEVIAKTEAHNSFPRSSEPPTCRLSWMVDVPLLIGKAFLLRFFAAQSHFTLLIGWEQLLKITVRFVCELAQPFDRTIDRRNKWTNDWASQPASEWTSNRMNSCNCFCLLHSYGVSFVTHHFQFPFRFVRKRMRYHLLWAPE